MALVADGGGGDSLFLSLASVTTLLGRFHLCGGRSALLLSQRPGGSLALGCAGCHTYVDGVRDDLAPLLRRRAGELQQTLGLDAVGQERLLAVLRGQQPPQHVIGERQQERHLQHERHSGTGDTHQQRQLQQQQQQHQQQQQQRQLQQQQQQQQQKQQQEEHRQQQQQHQQQRPEQQQQQQQQQQEEKHISTGAQQEPQHDTHGALQQQQQQQQQQQAESTPPAETKKTKAVYKNARCDVCSKVFYKRSNLRVHMLIHLGVRPHWCQKCGKSFSDPSTYSRHVASICGGQRHLTCHVCGKTFYHQVHLKEHLRKHTDEKQGRRYSCEGCGKSYACPGSLRRHRRGQCSGHGAVGNHSCSVCGKAFRRQEALAAHCRVHGVVTQPPGRPQQQHQQQLQQQEQEQRQQHQRQQEQQPRQHEQRQQPQQQQEQQQQQQRQQQQPRQHEQRQQPQQLLQQHQPPPPGAGDGGALEVAVSRTLTAVSAAVAESPAVSHSVAQQCRTSAHARLARMTAVPPSGFVARTTAVTTATERTGGAAETAFSGAGERCGPGGRTSAARSPCGTAEQGVPTPILPTVNVTPVKSEMFALRG